MILKSMSLRRILAIVFLIGGISAENLPPATKQPATPVPATASPQPAYAPVENEAKDGATKLLNNDGSGLVPPGDYPTIKADETVQDTYAKSVVIKDPYRVLENPDDPQTKKFIQEENAITASYLEKCTSRKKLTARYKEIMNHPTYIGLSQRGKIFFSIRNTGLQAQDVIYIQYKVGEEGTVFFDPNSLSEDGSVELYTSAFSDDGLMFGYITTKKGSDWQTLRFRNVETGEDYKEELTKLKHSDISWTKDNGVIYSGYPDYKGKTDGSDKTPAKNHKLLYHVVGTDQSADVVLAEFSEYPDYYVTGTVSVCWRYIIVTVTDNKSNNNLKYVADLEKIQYKITGKLDLIPLVTKLEAGYYYTTNVETKFIFQTNKDAPNYKLVSIDITNPSSSKDLIPEDKKRPLVSAQVAWENYLVIHYTEDVKSCLQLHLPTTGELVKKFDLEIGTVKERCSDIKYKDLYFNFESFLTPGITYHCDLSKPTFDLEVFKEITLPNFDKTKFTVEQFFYSSKDGTKVPMYCVYKKGLEKNGNNFTFMYAFGGFSNSILPYFAENRVVIIDNLNGMHCVPNIRGGGEYGEKWHLDGALAKKQNSIDDFLAAVEFLIKENYTNSKLIVVNGGANGGLTMLASLNQRPDLLGVVVADSPITDMLRFDQSKSGRAWVKEYGNATIAEDFQYLIKYSPLHNIDLAKSPNKQYPATMVTTNDPDDRVSPFHALKFVATLQAQAKNDPNQKNPLLLRVEIASDKSKNPTDKKIAKLVDMISFIILNTGIEYSGS